MSADDSNFNENESVKDTPHKESDSHETSREDQFVEKEKEEIMEELKELRTELKDILEENYKDTEQGILDRDQCVVNDKLKQEIQEQEKEQVENSHKECEDRRVEMNLVSERIKEECWDTFQEHSITLKTFDKEERNYEVSNFVLRIPDKKEKELLEKIKLIRRIEEVDAAKNKRKFFTHGLLGENKENGDDDSDDESNSKASNLDDDLSSVHSDDSEELYVKDNLLYSPFDLYTRQRKIIQIRLLHEEIRKVKEQFNKEFHNVLEEKKNSIASIDEKNMRMSEILNKLKVKEELFEPSLEDSEQPDHIFVVKEHEVPAEKYVPQEELERLEEQKKKDEQALDDPIHISRQRGLEVMMGGTLDEEEEELVEFDVEKPKCINKDPENLTAEEAKEVKEYEQKLKKHQEEEEKRKKQLEAELNNLKQEIKEICEKFDEKVKKLKTERLNSDQQVYEYELIIIKLSQSIIMQEEAKFTEKEYQSQLESIRKDKTKVGTNLKELEKEVSSAKDKKDKLISTDKQLESSFKSKIGSNLHKDAREALNKLLRVRNKYKNNAHEEMNKLSNQYQDITDEELIETSNKIYQQSLKRFDERPGAVPELMWEDFMKYHQQKWESEQGVYCFVRNLNHKQEEVKSLQEEDEDLRKILERLLQQISKHQEVRTRESYNVDMLFSFKQGQIEVEQEAVVTDYSDAILIHRSVVEELNQAIRSHNDDKIQILNSIKSLKSQHAMINWQTEKLQLQEEDILQTNTDLQLTRVTKDMQEYIKGGGEEHREKERTRLIDKLEKVKQNGNEKIKTKKRKLKRLQNKISELEKENGILESRVAALEHIVDERNQLKTLQSLDKDKERQQQRMKDLRKEKQLKDYMKAQMAEIKYLRNEVERMREKTFPSFAVVEKRNKESNPDFKQ